MPLPSTKHRRSNINSGFSFLELLIVVTIMALFFALGFANYRDYQSRQRIVAAGRLLKGDLRFTQGQALAGVKPPSPPNPACNTLNGYKFEYVNSTTYNISANCDSNVDILVRSGNLTEISPIINFQSAFSQVFFNILGRGVRMSGVSIPITLVNTATSETLTVTIRQGGEIY